MSEKPGPPVNGPSGFSTNSAYQTYQTYITYNFFVSDTFTYSTYDLLMLLMIYLWFTYDSLMIHLWNRQGGVCLSYLGKIPLTYYTYDYLFYLLYLCYLCYLWILMNISIPGTQLNIHEDERMKPENWIPLAWLPIINADKSRRSRRPTQGYEGSPARNCRLFHECWKRFLSNWDMFSTVHRHQWFVYFIIGS